jgi:hypothetical protein
MAELDLSTFDPFAQIYVAIAGGLSKDGKWPVSPGNFIRYDDIAGSEDPEKTETSDGDFPQAVLEGPISGTADLWTDDETFAAYGVDVNGEPITPVPVSVNELGKYTLRLIVTSDFLAMKSYSPLAAETLKAIRRLGPRLGKRWVTKVGPVTFTVREVRNEDSDTKQIEYTFLIPVETQIDSDTLTGT